MMVCFKVLTFASRLKNRAIRTVGLETDSSYGVKTYGFRPATGVGQHPIARRQECAHPDVMPMPQSDKSSVPVAVS